jgi:hypothetical protein
MAIGFSINFQPSSDIVTGQDASSVVTAPSFGGFVAPPTPNGGFNSLPSSNVSDWREAYVSRNIISWFVPEYGIVKMYVNPENITYQHKKILTKDRTKGGYTLQYWGEDLTQLHLTGTTGSSGVEGINVLYEIYRAEQLAFDTVGQALIDNSAANGAGAQILGGVSAAIGAATGSAVAGGLGGSVGGVLGAGLALGVFGASTFSSQAPRNITSLATMAFGVEMYYLGWVYRGFFEDMTVDEGSDHLGTMRYTITFTTTQRRGYRLNNLPWQRGAIDGPSNNDLSAGGIPMSVYNLGLQG